MGEGSTKFHCPSFHVENRTRKILAITMQNFIKKKTKWSMRDIWIFLFNFWRNGIKNLNWHSISIWFCIQNHLVTIAKSSSPKSSNGQQSSSISHMIYSLVGKWWWSSTKAKVKVGVTSKYLPDKMNPHANSWASNRNFFFNSSFSFCNSFSSMIKHKSTKFEGFLLATEYTLVCFVMWQVFPV